MKKKIFLLSIMLIVALTAASDEYIDPLTNVVYTYEPGQPTASVKAGYEEAVAPDYGYEGEVFYYPGSPDATGDVVILDKFTIGTTEYVVTSIDECAFWYNNKIKSVIIPNNVTDIGGGAFAHCNGLTSVTIGNGISSIGIGAFNFCSRLANVYCYAYNVPETSGYAFIDTPIASATLHVPAVSVEKYKATEPWQYFGNIVATASDIQHSGCLSRTRASSKSTTQSISLLKEGNILTVNLRNFWSTCDTQDFEVTPSVSDGNNSDPYTVSVRVKPIGEDMADCICPYNISFTIHDVEANSFQFKCWWFNGQVNLTEGEPWVMSNEYYPEGTKWTEIRLDTLKYDSWYSKVGDEWVPNFETVDYYVKGEYDGGYRDYKLVYTNGPEWTDSLTFLISESQYGLEVTVAVFHENEVFFPPGWAYGFGDWKEGNTLSYQTINGVNTPSIPPAGIREFGTITEIKEAYFGGVCPLKYVDLNGTRIINGIGVTEWNDGECIFGPVDPYFCYYAMSSDPKERHYRSMLVHFERNGEVLYDVWPAKETVSYTKDQMATIILPTEPDASKGRYYRLDRCEKGKIIFEEELSPKARIPYIIMPKEDFCIDLSTLDLDGLLRDTVSVKGASFIGSYSHEELSCQDGFYIDIIDATPDCQADDSNQRKAIVGALRACLIVSWDDPYNPGGSKGITEKRELVLKDNPNGIESLIPNPSLREGSIYDLQGRRLSEKPAKGLYIQNGVKRVVR